MTKDVLDVAALTTKSRRTCKVRTRPRHLIHRNCSKRALMGEEERFGLGAKYTVTPGQTSS